ncbi:alpha-2-macroglobulin family protein, partial [Cupriavidus basilensis OR16]
IGGGGLVDGSPQEASRLPIGIERKLYRLVPTSDGGAKDGKPAEAAAAGTAGLTFSAKPVKPGDKLDSNTLYVDEIVLSPRQGTYRYGLVEAPLPPGGEVEGTTWGLRIDGLPDPDNKVTGLQPFQRAVTYEMGMLSYHQPVVSLERPVVLRQLVRFSLPLTVE